MFTKSRVVNLEIRKNNVWLFSGLRSQMVNPYSLTEELSQA